MKWEYLVIQTVPFESDITLNEFLDIYGQENWELVQCDLHLFIFKRPKSPDIKAKELFDGDVVATRKAIEGYFGGKVG